jgi:chemotaxis response regulator CheB
MRCPRHPYAVEGLSVVPLEILIADDDTTIRLLLRRLLERQPDWQVCGEAGNGAEAIEKSSNSSPMLWLWIFLCRS